MSSAILRPFCLALNGLTHWGGETLCISALHIGHCSTLHWFSMMTSSNGNIFHVTGPLCGEFTGEFPSQRPVTRSFDVFFDMRLNKRLNNYSRRRWFETPSRSFRRHCDDNGLSPEPMLTLCQLEPVGTNCSETFIKTNVIHYNES